MEKKCKQCQKKKHINNYYRHSQMVGGYLNKCKECVKAQVRSYSRSSKGRASDKRRQQTENRRKWQTEYTRKKRRANPEAYKARTALNNAVRDGRIQKKPCEVCGELKVQAHHDDYSRPLHVRWLCGKCHRSIHDHFKRIE